MDEIIYHFGPPIMVTILTLYVGFKTRKADIKRQSAREAAETHRQEITRILTAIQKQNFWVIRKFTGLVQVHNVMHPEAKLEDDDYPNGF